MPLTTTPLSLRMVRIIWGVAVVFAIVCIVFGGFERKTLEGGLNLRHGLLFSLAVWSALSGFSTRRRLTNRACALASGTNPSASAKPWAAAQLVSIMSAESLVMWGLVSNTIIASPQWLSAAIYVAGVLLLFKFKPMKPSYISL